MARYRCSCGMKFKKQKDAEEHKSLMNDLQSGSAYYPCPVHFIMKYSNYDLFIDFAAKYWSPFMRITGAYIIYLTLTHHFKIDWTIVEASLMGIGIGLYLS